MIAIFAGSSCAAYIRLTPNRCRINIRTVLLDSTLQRMENTQNILFNSGSRRINQRMENNMINRIPDSTLIDYFAYDLRNNIQSFIDMMHETGEDITDPEKLRTYTRLLSDDDAMRRVATLFVNSLFSSPDAAVLIENFLLDAIEKESEGVKP